MKAPIRTSAFMRRRLSPEPGRRNGVWSDLRVASASLCSYHSLSLAFLVPLSSSLLLVPLLLLLFFLLGYPSTCGHGEAAAAARIDVLLGALGGRGYEG